MAGLLGYIAAGVAESVGTGVRDQAKERALAMREAAIAEIQHSRQLQRDQASREFQTSERIAGEQFRAKEGALERAAAAEERAAVRADKPKRTFDGPDGNAYYEDGSRVLPNVDAPSKAFRKATPEEAAAYGATAGQFGPDGKFHENNPPSGMSIESDGKGGFSLTQGPGAGKGGKLTEQQSKDLNYYQRGAAALVSVDQHEKALASGVQRFANGVPIGGNYLTSKEFQLGDQAGREFLASVLRKDSGAALTKEDYAIYGPMFLPQPGDGKEVIEQKRAARKRAMESMKLGLGSATDLADEPVTQNPGTDDKPATGSTTKRGVTWSVD